MSDNFTEIKPLNYPPVIEGVKNPNDRQVGGTHYQAGAGKCPRCGLELQHWDIVHMFGLDYFIGVATKYLWRLGRKGDPIEQIDKAIHYLEKKKDLIKRNQA